jgi:hypothetical protein
MAITAGTVSTILARKGMKICKTVAKAIVQINQTSIEDRNAGTGNERRWVPDPVKSVGEVVGNRAGGNLYAVVVLKFESDKFWYRGAAVVLAAEALRHEEHPIST